VAHPVSVFVDTFGTGAAGISDTKISQALTEVFDFRPAAIIEALELRKPQYRALAAYGHVGREDLGVKWEKTDKAEALKRAAGI
jgi:S-adenosylmethionine synthetase